MNDWSTFALIVFVFAWNPVADWLSAAMQRRLSK